MRITLTKACLIGSTVFDEGQEVVTADDVAKRLIEAGHAEEIEQLQEMLINIGVSVNGVPVDPQKEGITLEVDTIESRPYTKPKKKAAK